eukprot:jgi/Bigna1/88044/estExt_fgenesh1_pg.C_270131
MSVSTYIKLHLGVTLLDAVKDDKHFSDSAQTQLTQVRKFAHQAKNKVSKRLFTSSGKEDQQKKFILMILQKAFNNIAEAECELLSPTEFQEVHTRLLRVLAMASTSKGEREFKTSKTKLIEHEVSKPVTKLQAQASPPSSPPKSFSTNSYAPPTPSKTSFGVIGDFISSIAKVTTKISNSDVPQSKTKPTGELSASHSKVTTDDYDEWSRRELRSAAKGGKLKEYGVNGNSSSSDIRKALAASNKQDDFDEWTRTELRSAAKGGKLKAYGVNGNSTSDAIRRALRMKRKDKGFQSSKSSWCSDAKYEYENSTSSPVNNADFNQWSRRELRSAAKGGKLKEYGVNGNSSSSDIRKALAASNKQDDFDEWTRTELRSAAKGGKLKAYGVNGNSTSEAIRRALRRQANGF